MASAPKTLQQAILYFADQENCQKFLAELRWEDGKVRCPRCGSEKVSYLTNARLWKCYGNHEKAKFSIKVGTIMEDSALGLDKWLTAMWLLVNCKNGVSSCEVARDLGITQKSAWHMMHRIRYALHSGSFDKLSGEVEVDETYIGGKARNMHASRRRKLNVRAARSSENSGKVAVMGLLERHGDVRCAVLPNAKRATLRHQIDTHIEKDSVIYTDDYPAYMGLDSEYFHAVVNHAEKYVDGNVHTNTIENFWSCLKRGIGGTYVSVEPFHLFRYLDEQAYRYNTRKDVTEYDRFRAAAAMIVGKQLTWNRLTGKQGDGETCPN